jgi:hypothetical protein
VARVVDGGFPWLEAVTQGNYSLCFSEATL